MKLKNQFILSISVKKLTLELFEASIEIEILLSMTIFRDLICTSHFLDLHKEQQKLEKFHIKINITWLISRPSLSTSDLFLLSKQPFRRKTLLKTTLRHVCTSCYSIKSPHYKRLLKNVLKTKALCIVSVVGVARSRFELKFWLV